MRVSDKRKVVRTLFMLSVFVMAALPLMAWEAPKVVAANPGYKYYKPEIGFAPSGAVYIVYRAKDAMAGNSDIMMCRYDGKDMTYENVSASATFFSRYKSYESDIAITADNRIHVAWVVHDRGNTSLHYVKYRYKDGDTWSDIENLGTLHMHSGDVVFDLRLDVDNSGNVHVVLQEEHLCVVRYLAKYGDTILPVENIGNPGSRLKHPDIAVDDNYVHMIWMRKVGYPYVIMHQKRENRIGGAKSQIRQITFPKGSYASQKSRIDLDSQGYFHLAEFHKTGIIKKLKYYKEQPNGTLSNYVNLSSPSKLMLYHWAGLAVRDNSILATMQLGSTSGGNGLYANWKRNSQWGGYHAIPGTDGAVHQSVDLSTDGQVGAVAYGRYDSSIRMVSTAEISATGTLEVQFSHPGTIFWGSEVTFDASQCSQLNPDVGIVEYQWDFGDGTTLSSSSPTVTHSFGSYGTNLKVTLKIIGSNGESGSNYQDIFVHALYNGIVTSVQPKKIRTLFFNRPGNEINWTDNPKNAAAGYPEIVTYEIWRAPATSMKAPGDYVYVGEVEAGLNTYLDYQGLLPGAPYVYSIVSVDAEGHASPFNHQ